MTHQRKDIIAQTEKALEWLEALDKEFVLNLDSTIDSYENPVDGLRVLIDTIVGYALDPRVNGGHVLCEVKSTKDLEGLEDGDLVFMFDKDHQYVGVVSFNHEGLLDDEAAVRVAFNYGPVTKFLSDYTYYIKMPDTSFIGFGEPEGLFDEPSENSSESCSENPSEYSQLKRRRGVVRIPLEYRSVDLMIKLSKAGFIQVSEYNDFINGNAVITGVCPEFDMIPEGGKVPEYFVFVLEDGTVSLYKDRNVT